MKNLFIIEGLDGSGKKTQATLLNDYLNAHGQKSMMHSFPSYESMSSGPVKMYLDGQLCEKANQFDAYQTSALFAVDRLCTMAQLQKSDADVFVFDRYVESNVIHQGCKIVSKPKRVKFVRWLHNLEYKIFKLPRPTCVVFLNVTPEVSFEISSDRTEQKSGMTKDIQEQDKEFVLQSYKNALEMAKMLKWKIVNCVDKNGKILPIETIHEKIKQVVLPYIK